MTEPTIRPRMFPATFQVGLLLAGAVALRLAWRAYTHYIYEDAFITFRYAQNLAAGQGFVYNTHEQIYGTTTPLFALLLAVWLKIFPTHLILGANIFGLLSAVGALALTWVLCGRLGLTNSRRFVALTVLALSDKLWERDMGGMETPLVLCLMMATYYATVRRWPVWAGVAAGLLLWVRIDTVVWLMVVLAIAGYSNRHLLTTLSATAGLVYAPWLAFALLYFGSAIPHTLTAKWIAYVAAGNPPAAFSRSPANNPKRAEPLPVSEAATAPDPRSFFNPFLE